MMVSTSEPHQMKNSGLTLAEYWKMSEDYVQRANDAGIKVNGTVSTIWECPIEGPTELSRAIEFTKRCLAIVGLVSTEDMVVMMDEMDIQTNLDIDRILEIGKMVECIIGRALRSECIRTGRIPKEMKN